MTQKLLYVVPQDWYFWSHVAPLARAAVQQGFDVYLATREGDFTRKIESIGVTIIPLVSMDKTSKGILAQINNVSELIVVYQKLKPDVIHHVGLYSMFYGLMASYFMSRTKKINTVAGLGRLAISMSDGQTDRSKKWFVRLFRVLFSTSDCHIIFQNESDADFFIENGLLKKAQAFLIQGWGVSTKEKPVLPFSKTTTCVGYVGRFLWQKGIREIVEAAQIVKQQTQDIHFVFVGKPDEGNPSSISFERFQKWEKQKLVTLKNYDTNIQDVLSTLDIVVLPSYGGEGIPRILLQAAAAGIPMIATDVPGVTDICIEGETGIVIPKKNSRMLAQAIMKLHHQKSLGHFLGQNARKRVFDKFSDDIIIPKILAIYDD